MAESSVEMALILQPWFIFIGMTIIIVLQGLSLWLQHRRHTRDITQAIHQDQSLRNQWRDHELYVTETQQHMNNELSLVREAMRSHSILLENIQSLVDGLVDIPSVIHDDIKAQLDMKFDGLNASFQKIISQSYQNLVQQQKSQSNELSTLLYDHSVAVQQHSKNLVDATQNQLMGINDSLQHTIIKTSEQLELEVRSTRDYVETQLLNRSEKLHELVGQIKPLMTQAITSSSRGLQQQMNQDSEKMEALFASLTQDLSVINQLILSNEQHVISHVNDTHEQQFPRIKKVIVQAYQALKSQHLAIQSASTELTETQKQSQIELLQQLIPILQALGVDKLSNVKSSPEMTWSTSNEQPSVEQNKRPSHLSASSMS